MNVDIEVDHVVHFRAQWDALNATTRQQWTRTQLELVDRVLYAMKQSTRVDVVTLRNAGKTTLLAHLAVAWALARHENGTICYASLTGRHTTSWINSVYFILTTVQSTWPGIRVHDHYRNFTLTNAHYARVRIKTIPMSDRMTPFRGSAWNLDMLLVDEAWFLTELCQKRLAAIPCKEASIWIGSQRRVRKDKGEVTAEMET